MKLKIFVFLILVILILGLAVFGYFNSIPGAENQTNNLPKIEISPQDFDFGDIDYGQVVEYSFKIKNLGKEILEIKRVATSCACTTAKIAKEIINPGEETDLIVRYDTGLMAGSHGKGRQERIIYVKSNDPVNPQIEAVIYANVK